MCREKKWRGIHGKIKTWRRGRRTRGRNVPNEGVQSTGGTVYNSPL
jgi:hypothetical protein